MGISQASLARLYAYALLLGVVLGAFYDMLRISRMFFGVHYRPQRARRLSEIRLPWLPSRKKRGESRLLGTVVFFEDFLFCVLAGISLILLLYEANNGKFRALTVLCAAVGCAAYRGTLGRWLMCLSEEIAFVFGTAGRYLLFFLTLPLRWVWRIVSRGVERTVLRCLYAARRRKRRQYTGRMLLCVDATARQLLPPQMGSGQEGKKEGRSDGTKPTETIQSQPGNARISGSDGRDVHRRVRQQRDAIQRAAKGKGKP